MKTRYANAYCTILLLSFCTTMASCGRRDVWFAEPCGKGSRAWYVWVVEEHGYDAVPWNCSSDWITEQRTVFQVRHVWDEEGGASQVEICGVYEDPMPSRDEESLINWLQSLRTGSCLPPLHGQYEFSSNAISVVSARLSRIDPAFSAFRVATTKVDTAWWTLTSGGHVGSTNATIWVLGPKADEYYHTEGEFADLVWDATNGVICGIEDSKDGQIIGFPKVIKMWHYRTDRCYVIPCREPSGQEFDAARRRLQPH